MAKQSRYILFIMNHTIDANHRAKEIELPATAKNLEKMLQMVEKLKWAKAKIAAHILKAKPDYTYTDIAYITNRNYYRNTY